MKNYAFRGETHRAPNKDTVLRRLKLVVNAENLKLVKKIKNRTRSR